MLVFFSLALPIKSALFTSALVLALSGLGLFFWLKSHFTTGARWRGMALPFGRLEGGQALRADVDDARCGQHQRGWAILEIPPITQTELTAYVPSHGRGRGHWQVLPGAGIRHQAPPGHTSGRRLLAFGGFAECA